MKNTLILGIILLILGVGVLGYRQLTYTKRETVLEVGPIKATADRTKSIPLPPILGWALILAGGGVLFFSKRTSR